jgi:hypothetical protein
LKELARIFFSLGLQRKWFRYLRYCFVILQSWSFLKDWRSLGFGVCAL